MATLVLGAVGAGLGFLAGGPAGAQLGFNIGVIVGGILFAPHGGSSEQGRLSDLKATGSSYGALIPWVFGAARLGGNIIWATDLVEHTQSTHQGKGGGQTTKNYTYTCSFAISVCRGPIYGIRRIWAEDLLIYDSGRGTPSQYTIRVYNGDETQTADTLISSVLGAANTPAYRGQAYVVFENLPLSNWGNRIPSMSFEVAVDPGVTLKVEDILADFADNCGMAVGTDYDFSDASDTVIGFVLTQRGPAYSAVESLLKVFATDIAEVDGLLVAVRRGAAEIGTVPQADMGAHDWQGAEDNPPKPVESVRKSDLSLPFRYDVGYSSYERLYDVTTQGDVRFSRPSIQDQSTLVTSITMHDTDARQVASRLLDTEWLERVNHTISLGLKWLQIAPCSPILGVVDGKSIRMRALQTDISSFGAIAIQLVDDGSGGASGNRGYIPQPVTAPYIPPSAPMASPDVLPTTFDAYSGKEFRDQDGLNPGFYVIATGPTGWNGGTIYYSSNGTDWTNGGAIGAGSDFGVTTNTLTTFATPDGLDSTHTLSVQINMNGLLGTASANDVANGINAALCGVEILSYINVAAGSGVLQYDLTNLVRGHRSTSMSGHSTGERFWHLTDSIVRVVVPSALIGTTVHVRVLSPNQSISDVTSVDVVIADNNYPYVTPPDVGPIVEAGVARLVGATWLLEWNHDGVVVVGDIVDPGDIVPIYSMFLHASGDLVLDNTLGSLNPLQYTMLARLTTQIVMESSATVSVDVDCDVVARLELNGVILTPDADLTGVQTYSLALAAGFNTLRIAYGADNDFGIDAKLRVTGIGGTLDDLFDVFRAPGLVPAPATDSLMWTKYTKTYTDLLGSPPTIGSTQNIELFSLPAGGVIHAVKVKHSTPFSCSPGSFSTYTVSVGIAGNLTKYTAAFDVKQATGDTVQQFSSNSNTENHGAATSIRIAAIETGQAGLANANAGSVDVWVLTSSAL